MPDAVKRRLLDRIFDPSYLEGLERKPIEELRAMRKECTEAERELSFERRITQARIDIMGAELDRRAGSDRGDLVAKLPEILAGDLEPADTALPARVPDLSIPRNVGLSRRRIDEIAGEHVLSRLGQLEEEEIRGLVSSLGDYERELSDQRRRAHDVIDRIQSEVVRRYRSGEADPAAALG